MKRDPFPLVLAAVGWIGFAVVVVWTIAFLAGVMIPRTIDAPPRTSTLPALAWDVGLLVLFGLQHSVMSRSSVKAGMRRRVSEAMERAVYVVTTDICLAMVLVLWQPFGGQVWRVHGVTAALVWGVYLAGWLLAIMSTFAVDHLELTGLRQAGWAGPCRRERRHQLQVRGLHGIIRHPLMAGLIVAFWATPHMSASHLLFAVLTTGYIMVGLRLEERDLRRVFGPEYDVYAARVPALIPLPRRTHTSSHQTYPRSACPSRGVTQR